VLSSKSRLRFALILLCLIACTWQGFVAHTHFHADTSAHAVRLKDSGHPSDTNGASSCLLCEAVLLGAASALPAHESFLPPSTIGSLPGATDPSSLAITTVSFDWNSRGPPLT
jgi:hypothetical protein